MDNIVLNASSENDTLEIARQLALELVPGDCLGLKGPLGAGKTTFVKGLAEALEVKQSVVSPTYVLENVYPIGLKEMSALTLHHWDFYRLQPESVEICQEIEEFVELKKGISIIEWPERVPMIEETLSFVISIEFVEGTTISSQERTLTISGPKKVIDLWPKQL